MGGGGYYVFRFKVGDVANPHSVSAPTEQLEATLDPQILVEAWHRLKGKQ